MALSNQESFKIVLLGLLNTELSKIFAIFQNGTPSVAILRMAPTFLPSQNRELNKIANFDDVALHISEPACLEMENGLHSPFFFICSSFLLSFVHPLPAKKMEDLDLYCSHRFLSGARSVCWHCTCIHGTSNSEHRPTHGRTSRWTMSLWRQHTKWCCEATSRFNRHRAAAEVR